jgi:DNA-binding protein Fis
MNEEDKVVNVEEIEMEQGFNVTTKENRKYLVQFFDRTFFKVTYPYIGGEVEGPAREVVEKAVLKYMKEEENKKDVSDIRKIGMAAVERSDEETVVKACEGLKDIALASLNDLPNDPNYKHWEDYTPEEKKAKIDHIMDWLKPMIARLQK